MNPYQKIEEKNDSSKAQCPPSTQMHSQIKQASKQTNKQARLTYMYVYTYIKGQQQTTIDEWSRLKRLPTVYRISSWSFALHRCLEWIV